MEVPEMMFLSHMVAAMPQNRANPERFGVFPDSMTRAEKELFDMMTEEQDDDEYLDGIR